MTPAKKNGRNPCRTQPGEIRRVEYHDIYSSAEAAAFANVPKATVYRAIREGHLNAPELIPGHPRIGHAELLRWMNERDFPIPQPFVRRESRDDLLTLTGAARLARVSLDHAWEATEARMLTPARAEGHDVQDCGVDEPLPERTHARYRRTTVEAWRDSGALIACPQIPRMAWRPRVREYMTERGLTAALVAARSGGVLHRGIVQGMMNGTSEYCTFPNMLMLASVLEVVTGERPQPSQLWEWVPGEGHYMKGEGRRAT